MKATQILSDMNKIVFKIATCKDSNKRMGLWEQHSSLADNLIIEICKMDKTPIEKINDKELPECLRK